MSRRVTWVLAFALVGCADVVVKDDGGGGGDFLPDGAGPGEPAGVGGASAEDSEVPLDACGRLCNASTDAGCAIAGLACLDGCVTERSHGWKCRTTYDAWTECRAHTAGPAACEVPGTACPGEQAAHEACVTPPGNCDPRICEPEGAGTSCLQTCGGRAYETVCTPSGGPYPCECLVDGELVGVCGEGYEATSRCCDHAFQFT